MKKPSRVFDPSENKTFTLAQLYLYYDPKLHHHQNQTGFDDDENYVCEVGAKIFKRIIFIKFSALPSLQNQSSES